MAERFDAERLSPHDLTLLRERVSVEPWEMGNIVDALEASDGLDVSGLAGTLGKVNDLADDLSDVLESTQIYRLTKAKALAIGTTMDKLHAALDDTWERLPVEREELA